MKVIQSIKKIFKGILAFAFYCFAVIMTILLLNYNKYGVTQIDSTSLIIVREEMSSDNYKKGDLVFVEEQKISKISVGEELFVYQIDKSGAVSIDVGIVGEVHPDDNAISFKNGSTYAMDFVIGKADKIYNSVGTYLSIVESTFGFLFIVLVPSFLIFIYQLYALFIEIKYGKEEVPSQPSTNQPIPNQPSVIG